MTATLTSISLDQNFGIHIKQRPARDAVLERVATNHHRLLGFDRDEPVDTKLLKLGAWTGQLAGHIQAKHTASVRAILTVIAAHCAGWVESNPGPIKDVFGAISAERDRQIKLRRENPRRYLIDVAHPLPDPLRKYRVLLEEVGEVAKECDELEMTPKSRKVWPFLREELIQVAAVCVAWLESMEGDAR